MVKVRDYQASDQSELARIYLECRQATFHWIAKGVYQHDDFSKDIEGEKLRVAHIGSVVVGFVSVWEPEPFIHHLYIDPSHQDNGVGELLMKDALSWMGRPARLKCVVRNLRACAFYEKHGWKIESSADDSITGPYYNYIYQE